MTFAMVVFRSELNVTCPICNREEASGYCHYCGANPRPVVGPSLKSSILFGVFGLALILFWNIFAISYRDSQPTSQPMPPTQPKPDDAQMLISHCGKPDGD